MLFLGADVDAYLSECITRKPRNQEAESQEIQRTRKDVNV